MKKFLSIDYLKQGNKRQQLAYMELTGLGIMDKLIVYNPLLAGTIPIGIDISTSDLDIICSCKNHEEFSNLLTDLYRNQNNFQLKTKQIDGVKTTIATFNGKYFPVEIFGQITASAQQNAFKHMLIEHKIIQEKGSMFAQKIIDLKKSGLKTEPAFAILLGIKGNPYQELLKL